MFHEDSHNYIHKYKLSHKDKDDKEHWSNNPADTAVVDTII